METVSLISSIISIIVGVVSIVMALYSMNSQKKSSQKIEITLSRLKSIIVEQSSDINNNDF